MERTAQRTPPSPPQGFIGGHFFQWRKNALDFYMMCMREYGGLVRINLMGYDAYVITEPELVQQVLTKDNRIWHKSMVYKRILADYLGEGLLISDGDFWRRQRKLMQPAFHHNRISAYADTMVTYTQRMMQNWHDQAELDIAQEMMQVTLYIVGKTLFDADLARDTGLVEEALDHLLRDVITEARQGMIVPKWLPTPLKRRKPHTIALLDAIMSDIIEQRRQHDEDTGDLLSMMLQARDEDGQGMSDKQLRDEALTIVLAGHETTANALAWCFYELAHNPHVEAKLHQEVDTVLQGRTPTMDDLKNLPYTEKVIKEALRKWPPAWNVSRAAQEDTELGGYPIKKYSVGLVSAYCIHHDERWYPEPDTFDPERFTPQAEAERPRYSYIPFGGGPRVCIGNMFAMMEAQLILASIVQRYRLTLKDGYQPVPEPLVTLRPKGGMPMRLQQREAIAASEVLP